MLKEVQLLDGRYQQVAELGNLPYSERVDLHRTLTSNWVADGTWRDTKLLRFFKSSGVPVELIQASNLRLRAAQCLVCMARWQVSTGNPTDNLAEAVEAAGLAEVPIDPYSDKPLKIALIDQAPVLYSLGPDGDDDQASVEVPLVRAPTQDPPDGDIIFKL